METFSLSWIGRLAVCQWWWIVVSWHLLLCIWCLYLVLMTSFWLCCLRRSMKTIRSISVRQNCMQTSLSTRSITRELSFEMSSNKQLKVLFLFYIVFLCAAFNALMWPLMIVFIWRLERGLLLYIEFIDHLFRCCNLLLPDYSIQWFVWNTITVMAKKETLPK